MIGQVKTTTPRLKRLSVGLASKDPTCSPFSTASSEKHYAGDHVTPGGQRMSLHENLLMRILSTPSESPLHDRSPDDDAVSTTTPQRSADDSFDSCLSGSATPVLELLNVDSEPQPGTSRPEGLAANPHMMRLFRDLNSPSATSRLRALRALKSPSKRVGYFNFDVPHEQQDIITSEERDGPVTRNIKDVLRDVVVYVEVRSGSDNRSNGIKQHIASLGARVNERLLKDTTHVIFKDGLLSTFQKAKKMNIPVVSILWIEACKRHTCLMNPSEFKISNLERYENPELFKRIRRQKSMQPGAQERAGNKKRPVVAAKGSAVLSPPTKLPTLHRLGKNDRLEQILNDFDNQVAGTNSEPVDEYDEMLRAGPMRLLERFRSTPTAMDGASISSPAAAIGTATADDENATDGTPTGVNGTTCEPLPISRRALFSAMKKDKSETATPRTRRKTILLKPQMTKVAEEPTASKQQTPVAKSNVSNRRKTIVASVTEDSDSLSPSVFNPERTGRSRRNTIVVTAEINVTQQGEQPPKNKLDMTTSKLDKRRKTVVDDNLSASKDNSPPPVVTVLSKRTRRKTIAFVNDENTPPSTTAGHALSALKSCTGVQYGSIYSPKDMDFSQAPNGPSSNELAKGPSNGTTMSFSTTSGNDGTGMSIVEKTDASAMAHISVGRQTIFEPPAGLHSTQQSIEMALASPCNGSRRRTTLSTTRSNTFSEPLQLTASATKSLSLSASRNLTQHGRDAPASSPKVTHEPPKTLLQEYQSSLRFDSARAPERRRQTVFDITMDIVDQRLSEINRRAAAAKESRQRTMTPKEKSSSGSSIEITPDLKTPPPATQQTSLNEYFKKTAKSVEKSTKSNDSTVPNSTVSGIMESSELTGESVASDVPRKRKLFNVQTLSEDALVNKPNDTTTVTPKPTPKRRSLAPAAMAPNLATQSAKKRRTTMFFVSPVPAAESQAEVRRKQPHVASRGLPTVGSQYPTASRNYLATTNLHTEQSAFVKEVRFQ